MKIIILISTLLCFNTLNAIEHKVSDSNSLKVALLNVKPGDIISLSDGIYKGNFKTTISGTKDKPITIQGTANAILTSDSLTTGYGFHLLGSYWKLNGFTVKKYSKGVMLDGANFNILDRLNIEDVGSECVHFRIHSSDNTIQNCKIKNCGLTVSANGEAIYIGSSVKNWSTYTNGKPDLSNRNKVLNNIIGPGVTEEAVDIKEGTFDGLIQGNTFNGQGMVGSNGGDAWINAKGFNYTIKNNVGKYSVKSGYKIRNVDGSVNTSGCGNKIIDNKCSSIKDGATCVDIVVKVPCAIQNESKNNIIQ